MTSTVSTIDEHFNSLEDPRKQNANLLHDFKDILVISISAIISGADNWVAVVEFGKQKFEWLSTFLSLENGIPSHDVFSSVFSMISTNQFQECFVSWVNSICDLFPGEVVAIDGKTLRRSHDKSLGLKAAHIVSAWANKNKMVLGQVKTSEKSNEITAIPELLNMLQLEGCLVTIDAMGCQKKIVESIITKGADYLIAVKDNQPKLFTEIKSAFKSGDSTEYVGVDCDFSESIDDGHGRVAERRCWVLRNYSSERTIEWDSLVSIVMIESTRIVDEITTIDYRYYITSTTREAKYILEATQEHWGIENSLHWVLDIAFREDEKRNRKGNGAANFSILRHIATNLLKKDKSKLGIANKMLKAAWSDTYREKLLSGLSL